MMIRRVLFLSVAVMLGVSSLCAQTLRKLERRPMITVGPFGAFSSNVHHTDATIYDCPECGTFSSGSGRGYHFGFTAIVPALVPALDPMLSGYLSAGLAERGGNFGEATTGGLPLLDPTTNTYVDLKRLHAYNATLPFLTLNLGVSVLPLDYFPIFLRLGGGMEFPLSSSATYKQTEEIVQPSGVLYPDTKTRKKTVGSGELKNITSPIVATASLGYRLPVGGEMTASPSLSYQLPLTPVSSAMKWKISSIEVGLEIGYTLYKEASENEPPFAPPIVAKPPKARPLRPRLQISAIESAPIPILQTVVTETFPILPYIFFDSGSAMLPSRYVQLPRSETIAFSERELPRASLEAYHNLLNILGRRMAATPASTITLLGTTDITSDQKLATARTEEIKDYLVSTWEIGPERINITTGVPTYPSTTDQPEGRAENRRVEITASDESLLRPLLYERFKEYSSAKQSIPIRISVRGNEPVESWSVAINHSSEQGISKPIATFQGNGEAERQINWNIDSRTLPLISTKLGADTLGVVLQARIEGGEPDEVHAVIPVTSTLNPIELSRLSLVVFDFDRGDLTPQNESKIREFAVRSLFPTSSIKITGATDSLGELSHNQKLSLDRAQNVERVIVSLNSKAAVKEVKGLGEIEPIYGWSTPEGRYYSRTVTVEVETPLKDVISSQQ